MSIPKNSKSISENLASTVLLGCSLLVLVLLGTRQIVSYDLGYHLAFGETFFESGKIVDHTPFIYTLPPLDAAASERPEPGPGNWYDSKGRYRFPNANWLSQLFIYGAWALAGAAGLTILQALLLLGIALLMIIAMMKARVPPWMTALALLLVGATISFRLTMRPELFGYLCLTIQFLLLTGLAIQPETPEPPSLRWVTGMLVIQLLFVNLHSYFLLGFALTGAVLTEYVFLFLKLQFRGADVEKLNAYKKVLKRLIITLVGMVLISFVNPWGWRLVLLPLQTLLYMKKYAILGNIPDASAHPWSHIIEFGSTFIHYRLSKPSGFAIVTILLLTGLTLLSQIILLLLRQFSRLLRQNKGGIDEKVFQARWALCFIIVGMILVGLKMHRNAAVASLIVIPALFISLNHIARYLLKSRGKDRYLKMNTLANAAVLFLCVGAAYQITSGKLYEAESLPTRFGFGLSSTMMPIGAASWLDRYAPDARVWSDFGSSSTIHFFTRPHRAVPILSNTWAYPPRLILQDSYYRFGKWPVEKLAEDYNVDAVVVRPGFARPLTRQLGADPDWKMVHVEGINVLFMRSNDTFKELAEKHEIRTDNFDPVHFVSTQFKKDPSLQRSVISVSEIFENAGEIDLAINVFEAGIRLQAPTITGWKKLLNLYIYRLSQRRKNNDKRFIDDLKRMKTLFEKILELDPQDIEILRRLESLKQDYPML